MKAADDCQQDDVDMVPSPQHISVHWFRHGLRIHDNPALLKSLDGAKAFYPIFIFDGETAGMKDAKFPRMRFFLETLKALDQSFQAAGGRLFCLSGKPVHTFKKLIKEWGITRVTFEQDPEPIWLDRDNSVKQLLRDSNIEWIEEISHTLWDPLKICKANGGRAPHMYKLFNQITELLGPPPRPCPRPQLDGCHWNIPTNFSEFYELPTLEDLGVHTESEKQLKPFNRWLGGEAEALKSFHKRMEHQCEAYKKSCLMPNQQKPDIVGPSHSMSPHLRFGSLSIRLFYWTLHDEYIQVCKEDPPSDFAAQLLWREFFYCMSFNNINYGKMENNPICLQINWYKDEEKLERWRKGLTGFPWIDAIMTQLKEEGWVHHLARHAIACFLTRGDLWISWVDGFEHMVQYLLDGDWSVCAGSWMWVSSSAFENCLQCPNCFSPVMFGMYVDSTGEYIRRYLPVLKDMPLKYLFSPWKAPLAVQEAAGCRVGIDYPEPIVDHAAASRKNKQMMEGVKAILKDPNIWHCAPSDSKELAEYVGIRGTEENCNCSENCRHILSG